jgi:hypothetical protein
MRLATTLTFALAFASASALADDHDGYDRATADGLLQATADATSGVAAPHMNAPRFAFGVHFPHEAPDTVEDVKGGDEVNIASVNLRAKSGNTVAYATDGTAAWVAADLWASTPCGMTSCMHDKPDPMHATALYDKAGGWQPVTWMASGVHSGAEQTKAIAAGVKLMEVARKIDGAEDVVKQFEATIGDAKALAATVSARKDVVLYGSDLGERYVGGAQVRAKLIAWALAFKVRDGVQAGVTSSKTVAWVAANVDASSAKHPKDKPVPYRMLLVYEQTAGAWQLVQAQFSFSDI